MAQIVPQITHPIADEGETETDRLVRFLTSEQCGPDVRRTLYVLAQCGGILRKAIEVVLPGKDESVIDMNRAALAHSMTKGSLAPQRFGLRFAYETHPLLRDAFGRLPSSVTTPLAKWHCSLPK